MSALLDASKVSSTNLSDRSESDTRNSPDQRAATFGFGSREYLAYAFKQATGLTPREFRRRVRGR
jgi:AraC-like DNA-binding protein